MKKLHPVLADMKQLGFSEYECKAYLALLEEYPQNGYSLSKNSGIPRSRIYEVLKNLIAKQMVFKQREEKNIFYYPVEPDIFINNLKSSYNTVFSNLSEHTRSIYREKKKDDKLVVIKGSDNIIRFLRKRIAGAEKRIALSIWEDEIKLLYKELDKAISKGVILRGIYFGSNNRYDELVPHRRMERYMAEKNQRFMSIIIDGLHSVSGIVSRGDESQVTWTQDEGFIEISEDYIAHDLLVNLYSASLDKEAYRKFEDFADNVHDYYFSYSKSELAGYKSLIH